MNYWIAEQEPIIDFQKASLEFASAVSEPVGALNTFPSVWAIAVLCVLCVGGYLWSRSRSVWVPAEFAEQAPIIEGGPSLTKEGLFICLEADLIEGCFSMLVDRLVNRFQVIVIAPPSQFLPPFLGSVEVISPNKAKKHLLDFEQRLSMQRAQGVVLSTVELPKNLLGLSGVFVVNLGDDVPSSWKGSVYGVSFEERWIWKNQSI